MLGVRAALGMSGFSQNPCLECGNKWADSPFVKLGSEAGAGVKPSGRKSALLVGCNYPGTKASLEGCVNDVWAMQVRPRDTSLPWTLPQS